MNPLNLKTLTPKTMAIVLATITVISIAAFYGLTAFNSANADTNAGTLQDFFGFSSPGETSDQSESQAICGNNTTESGEECDGFNLNEKNCQSFGYAAGILRCNEECEFDLSACVLSEDVLVDDEASEVPGGAAGSSGGTGGSSSGSGAGGGSGGSGGGSGGSGGGTDGAPDSGSGEDPDATGEDGEAEESQAICGNAVREEGEFCDGTDLAGASCTSLGFAAGALACTNECQLDTTACVLEEGEEQPSVCGNGVKETGEFCDGSDFGNDSCAARGYDTGNLSCGVDCVTINDAGCSNAGAPGTNCGNNVKEEGEECDGTDLAGETCETQGLLSGHVSCYPDCTINITGCLTPPPEGTTEDVCNNGLDDDGDGLTDCFDPDCEGESFLCTSVWEFPSAQETYYCEDGIDNDADGYGDCNDPDCTSFHYDICSSYTCSDTDDGRYDYLNHGICTDDLGEKIDECNGLTLIEYGCNSFDLYNYCVSRTWECPDGCSAGRCTGGCTDTDETYANEGYDLYTQGTVTDASGGLVAADICEGDHVLREHHCLDDGSFESYTIDCRYVESAIPYVIPACADGVCCRHYGHKECDHTNNRSYWYDTCGQQGAYENCAPGICVDGECSNDATIFVTSETWTPNFGGLSGADAKCQEAASNAGFSGVWIALMSDESRNATDRMPDIVYKKVNGTIVANNEADLFDGSILSPIDMTELGSTVTSSGVWSGTNVNGNSRVEGDFCNNWSSNNISGYYGSMGFTDKTDSWWIESGNVTCEPYSLRLYCIKAADS